MDMTRLSSKVGQDRPENAWRRHVSGARPERPATPGWGVRRLHGTRLRRAPGRATHRGRASGTAV